MIKVNSLFIIAVLAASSLAVSVAAFAALQPTSSATSMSFEDANALPKSGPDIDGRSKDQVNSILNTFNSSPHVRADILISAKRNDGTPIEYERFEEIRTELATQFGGVTVLPRFNGTSIRDGVRNDGTNNSGFFVVVENKAENVEWLIQYKQELKERLNQDRIFMTFSPTVIAP
jgi:hypothetical protein